jgi:hypothetical protein
VALSTLDTTLRPRESKPPARSDSGASRCGGRRRRSAGAWSRLGPGGTQARETFGDLLGGVTGEGQSQCIALGRPAEERIPRDERDPAFQGSAQQQVGVLTGRESSPDEGDPRLRAAVAARPKTTGGARSSVRAGSPSRAFGPPESRGHATGTAWRPRAALDVEITPPTHPATATLGAGGYAAWGSTSPAAGLSAGLSGKKRASTVSTSAKRRGFEM